MSDNIDPRGAAASDVLVRLDSVSRRYTRGSSSVVALDSVSLDVRRGEMVALIGPSGCGKSTCLNLIAGIDRPDEGRALVLGVDLARASESELVLLRRRKIGIVFQAFHLVPHLSVAENVALPLAIDGKRDPARVAELVARVGLAARASHFPGELSGGEEQRTAVARALVHRPLLVVADEPTGNLDSSSGEAVLALLDELRAETGAALVVATHDARVAARASRVIRLRDGRVEVPACS
ncbi:MAG: ABC transporter ATP-binding protein [Planctomycetes bacterium]|nr:ABC transporter ATP-binding protein [Planctomycetota bacterium]